MTASAEVPGLYQVSLDGRAFLVDLSSNDGGFTSASVPAISPYLTDAAARPGEQSLNRDDLWRRSVESWHHGAGQGHADRDASDPYRFRTSLHADVFTKYQIGVLNTVAETAGPATVSGGSLVVANQRLFWATDDSLNYALSMPGTGLPPFVYGVTGLPATIWSIAADGQNVYSVHGVDDVYVTLAASPFASSEFANTTADLRLIRYAKERILVFDNAGSVYNPTVAGSALPAALFTHRLAGAFTWTDATEGTANIYMSGYSGQGSEAFGVIYRTAIQQDGTDLDAPIIAMRLPDGEQALAVCGYEGFVLIGTSLGVRVCLEQSDGSLELGALIETGPCHCFEPQGSQVWFGWSALSDFDATNAGGPFYGLGRIDLSEFQFGSGTPAYATDLMQSDVAAGTTQVVTYKGVRVFVNAQGVFGETDTRHASAYMVSGLFGYGLTDTKTYHYLTVKDDDSATLVTTSSMDAITGTTHPTRTNLAISDGLDGFDAGIYDLAAIRLEQLEYMVQYFDHIKRVTLLGRPAIQSRAEEITVTLSLPTGDDIEGLDRHRDVAEEMTHLRALMRMGNAVDFNDGTEIYSVIVEDYTYIRLAGDPNTRGRWNGMIQVKLKRNDTSTPVFRSVASLSQSGAVFSLPTPDGCQIGDVLFAAVAWATSGVAVPTPSAGWTLLADQTDTHSHSATFWRMPGTLASLDLTFASSVQAVGVMAAYTQGDPISLIGTDVGVLSGPNLLDVAQYFTNTFGAVCATVSSPPHASAVLVGPVRTRLRVTRDLGTGRDLIVEVGDAVSNSTLVSDFVSPGAVTDALGAEVPYEDEVRVYTHSLDKPST